VYRFRDHMSEDVADSGTARAAPTRKSALVWPENYICKKAGEKPSDFNTFIGVDIGSRNMVVAIYVVATGLLRFFHLDCYRDFKLPRVDLYLRNEYVMNFLSSLQQHIVPPAFAGIEYQLKGRNIKGFKNGKPQFTVSVENPLIQGWLQSWCVANDVAHALVRPWNVKAVFPSEFFEKGDRSINELNAVGLMEKVYKPAEKAEIDAIVEAQKKARAEQRVWRKETAPLVKSKAKKIKLDSGNGLHANVPFERVRDAVLKETARPYDVDQAQDAATAGIIALSLASIANGTDLFALRCPDLAGKGVWRF